MFYFHIILNGWAKEKDHIGKEKKLRDQQARQKILVGRKLGSKEKGQKSLLEVKVDVYVFFCLFVLLLFSEKKMWPALFFFTLLFF